MAGVGWGAAAWGASPWGGAIGASLQLASAVASRENAVQLAFTLPVYFSGILDAHDASQRGLYAVAPVPLSTGMDGTAPRAVAVAAAAVVDAPGFASGQVVELTLDRPMTPSPSLYTVTCAGLVSADMLTPLDPGASSAQFSGCFKKLVVPTLAAPSAKATRDLASPQTLEGARAASAAPELVTLGVLTVDDTRDYAFDEGLVAYKKRVLRRLITTPGGFVHLGLSYGVGLLGFGKKLATASNRQALVALCEQQVQLEPETAAVKATLQQQFSTPGLFRLVLLARTRTGQGVKLVVPVVAAA